MRLRDLFVDYCMVDDIKIVRVLNLDMFFAISNSDNNEENSIMVYYLYPEYKEQLLCNELKKDDMLKDMSEWHELKDVETILCNSDLMDYIDIAKKNGFVFEKDLKKQIKKLQKDLKKNNDKNQNTNELTIRLRDLLTYYCSLEDVQILKLLDTNQYFALMPFKFPECERLIISHLNYSLVDKLLNNELTKKDLPNDIFSWDYLEHLEMAFWDSLLINYFKRAKKRGLVFGNDVEKKAKLTILKENIKIKKDESSDKDTTNQDKNKKPGKLSVLMKYLSKLLKVLYIVIIAAWIYTKLIK